MRLNNFSAHYKRKYGEAVGKIALSLNDICPNRLKGGCVFCAPVSFRPFYLREDDALDEQLRRGKIFLSGRKFRKYFVYFQQETSTSGPVDIFLQHLRGLLAEAHCVGAIISTRPDYISDQLLRELNLLAGQKGMGKEIILEIGLQSANNRTLTFLNRNHTYEQFVESAHRVSAHSFLQLGAHVILGIPGESLSDMRKTIAAVKELRVKHLKIHHLQVIKGAKLDEMYRAAPFETFSVNEYMELLSGLLKLVPKEVVIHRLWSTSDSEVLVAPRWGMNNHALSNLVREVMLKNDCAQGDLDSGSYVK